MDLEHLRSQDVTVVHAGGALLDLPDSLIQQHLLPKLAPADKKMLR